MPELNPERVREYAEAMYAERQDRPLDDADRRALSQALAQAAHGSVLARLALDVALSDGARDWPAATRSHACRLLGLREPSVGSA